MEEAKKQFTVKEVEEGNGKGKTMFIVYNNVYDVTPFLNEHPGGEEVLLEHGGKDASEDFSDVGHSKDAIELMKKYQIGELVESERRNVTPKKGWVANYESNERQSYMPAAGMQMYLLLGAVFVAALALYYYF